MALATEPTGTIGNSSSLRGEYSASRSKNSLNHSQDKQYHSPNFTRKTQQPKPTTSSQKKSQKASQKKGGNNKKKQTNHLLLQASMGTQKVSSFANNA